MRINNETDYRAREIKSLLVATHNHIASTPEGRLPQWKAVIFTIKYTRTRVASGHAYRNGYRSTLRLRRPEGRPEWPGAPWAREQTGKQGERMSNDYARARDVVRVGWHEMFHLYGYGHDHMARMYPDAEEVEEICEAAGMEPSDPLPLYASARKDGDEDEPSDAEKYAEKLRHALEKRKEWTSKAKRAKTYLSKWRQRENYARRQLRELGVDPDEIASDILAGYDPAMPGDIKIT